MIVSIGILGGIIAGHIYQAKQNPRYLLGHTIGFSCVVVQTILTVVLRFLFTRLNRRRSEMNEEEIQREIQRYNGSEIGDRHPTFRYIL